MNNREAIEVLQQDMPCEDDPDLIEAMRMAIAALEKQIPKQRFEKDQDNEDVFTLRCPTCGAEIGIYNKRLDRFGYMVKKIYCYICGQAIDFSKPREE